MTTTVPDRENQENEPRMTARQARRRRVTRLIRPAVTALLLALALPAAGTAHAAGTATATPAVEHACAAAPAGQARCLALVRTDVHGGLGVRGPAAAAKLRAGASTADTRLPDGYGPADLRAAYRLPATGGADQTIALVDAYDDPTAEADLAVYRATYGLPPCTTDNGCFRKVNQRGDTAPLPASGAVSGWATETALDLEMASAACPQCRILLVEADEPTMGDLAAAVDTSVALGATEVSNSYGGTENHGTTAFAKDYSHPGVAVVASSGDSGYTVPSFPAAYSGVVAVGGTSLNRADNDRGWQETAWSGSGSGCSAWVDKPAWQQDTDCPGRTIADVSAVADPDTGLAVYVTSVPRGSGGWTIVGGTSASAPYVAGVIALAGHPGAYADASRLYSAPAASLNDVTDGSNGNCEGDYLCTAVPGYDAPTGNGTPNGLAAF
ncbi:S53 family peptidase [Streptomyces gilvus]|uniref:S53 family peptidase n=1 Tax=Streptomyces gilvus TaxID=2920937 RepID=UPI001F0FD07B|nr:S53 family peptidase [Streptomyces sp. CME 23]MCH5676777.1 S53 family peptidase [Streptomyces sp. CME 23]